MRYVYILQSEADPDRYYTGVTDDLRNRVVKHNSGSVTHTAKYRPWSLKTYIAFNDPDQANASESYLKTASGRAFAKKRL
ncbi:MAG: GIY-YIG nuclease family protein [Pseudomonadota bacterium]